MVEPRSPASRVSTWALAIIFVIAFDGVFTRSTLLWGPTTFEETRDIGRIVFAQTYQAARKIYAREHPKAARRIVLLGDSRLQLPVREETLAAELRELLPAEDFAVYNLGIFGATLGDVAAVSLHIGEIDPSLVVLAVDDLTLIQSALSGPRNLPAELMNIGWRDGPIADDWPRRIERWSGTAWRLFRFREFARAALFDRVWPSDDRIAWPDWFPDERSLFAYAHGDERAGAIAAAYRRWIGDTHLPSYVEYLSLERGGYLDWVRERARDAPLPETGGVAVRVLDAILRDLSREFPGRIALLFLPRNPLLDEDVSGEYERREIVDRGLALIRDVARRNGVAVIDERASMPARAFFDFDHMFPDQAGFEPVLAEEIARALSS